MDGGLRRIFRANLPEFHWTSIESSGTGGGIPDANYCATGIEGWIEYKKTAASKVIFQPAQIGWLEQRTRAGGRTFIAVRRKCHAGPRREAVDELWLFRGADARVLRQEGLTGAAAHQIGRWSHGPNKWVWTKIGDILKSRSA
jgi:hypothetical protein